jgi:replication factor A1
MDLMDSNKVQIQATFFNDAAKKWEQEMQEGKVYSMSNGQVKMANKRFTTIPHDHCLSFDMQARIQEIEDNTDGIQGSAYNFTTLKSVQEATQVFMIDLIAVLSEV